MSRKALELLDRHAGAAILLAALLVMGGVTWSATSDAPVEESLLKRLEMAEGPYRAAISLSKGTEKPIVFSPEGRTLLDVSAWETRVKVNGATHVLYRDVYNAAAVDGLAYVTWSNPLHQLEQRIEVTDEGVEIRWSWMRHLGAPPQDVTLDLAEFAYHMRDASFDGRVVTYRLDAEDPRQPPSGAGGEPYAVRIALDRAPEELWFGETPEGVDGVHLRYRVPDPPAGVPVVFLTQRLTYERSDAPLPPPSGERRAVPALDESVREVALRAGDLRLRLPLFDGAHKPLLQDAAGRDLLEVSGWESFLTVDGERAPLYRRAFEVTHDDASAKVTWRGEGYALEQRMRLASGALTLDWTWRGEADAPARNVTLEVAHFSRYMRNVSSNGERVAWSLDGSGLAFDARLDPAPSLLRIGETPEGVDSLRATWRARPPPDEAVLLASETFLVGPGPAVLVGPSPERVAVPVEDERAEAVLLEAGDHRASLALARAAAHPLLRTAAGRDVLEISTRQSHLLVEREHDRHLSLYALDHSTRIVGERACTTFEDPELALRECVRVTSAGMNVTWEWRRAEGAPAREAELTLAHFAFFMRDPTFVDGTLGYLLDAADGGRRHRVAVAFEPAPARHFFGGPPGATDALRAVYVIKDAPEGEWIPVAALEVTHGWE